MTKLTNEERIIATLERIADALDYSNEKADEADEKKVPMSEIMEREIGKLKELFSPPPIIPPMPYSPKKMKQQFRLVTIDNQDALNALLDTGYTVLGMTEKIIAVSKMVEVEE